MAHCILTPFGRVGALLLAERRMPEMIADGAALIDILEELCRTVDAQQLDVISAVLLMEPEGKRLWPAAGSRVPVGWARVITPVQIGPDADSYGTVAFLKQTVIISDIATDPLFELADYRSLALSHGLRAAWYQLLFSGLSVVGQVQVGAVTGKQTVAARPLTSSSERV
jgi:hypothetical protein